MSKASRTVATLIQDANDAAAYSAHIEHLTSLGKSVGIGLRGQLSEPLSLSDAMAAGVAFSAMAFSRVKNGYMTGMPPNPAFTREAFLTQCAIIFDAVDPYITACVTSQEDQQNDADKTKP